MNLGSAKTINNTATVKKIVNGIRYIYLNSTIYFNGYVRKIIRMQKLFNKKYKVR